MIILLAKIVVAVVVLLVLGLVILAGWAFFTDRREAQAEAEGQRRLELESCLRHQPPHASFDQKATKGFRRSA